MPYSTAIDMWSFGCIMVELYTGYPIFPGENETQQLLCIMEYLGVPPNEYLGKTTRRKMFFDTENRPKLVVDSKGKIRKPGTKRITELLKTAEGSFIRFVECCFVWEPNFRITPQQALLSEWITDTSKLPSRTEGVKESQPFTCKNSNKKFMLFD
jgi:dual specificity tyrosine-phosphorylation-regulated kinase 2/3/4